jgi:class 3 adenylate cyclase
MSVDRRRIVLLWGDTFMVAARLRDLAFPEARLKGTPWAPLWQERQYRSIALAIRVALAVGALTYLLHYVLVDRPLGLEPRSLWLAYRVGVAALCGLGLALTFTRGGEGNGPRFVAFGVGAALCFLQARSMVWYPGVPYLYAVLVAVIVTLLLQLSSLDSSLVLAALLYVQLPSYDVEAIGAPQLLSAFLIAFASVILFRARMAADVAAFVAEQEKLDTEKRLIETEISLSQEIRAFLPREIYHRILRTLQYEHATVVEAVERALEPRRKTVGCLFSDIRGFTLRSKDLAGYLTESALPNIRSCTELVESHQGIPRLVGDLIFAYFDSGSADENIANSLRCGMALVQKNAELNAKGRSEPVRRFVLLSYGEAVVGNIGGQDSSREITALGPPVNILSRMDLLTKDEHASSHLRTDSVILSSSAATALGRLLPQLSMQKLDLRALNTELRDFPEEHAIWLLPVTSENLQSANRTVAPSP